MLAAGRHTLDLATKIRLGFAIICLLYAALNGVFLTALPWVLLVVGLDLALALLLRLAPSALLPEQGAAWLLLTASALSAAMAFNLYGPSAAPLSFIPAYHAGELYGRLGYLTATFICALSGGVAVAVQGESYFGNGSRTAFFTWLVGTAAMGALGQWSRRQRESLGYVESAQSREARALLERLHDLSTTQGTELDPPSIASQLLDRLAQEVPHSRAVVLAAEPGGLMLPIALRGALRLDPHALDKGTLEAALASKEPTTVHWRDELGKHSGVLIPMGTSERIGSALVVLDRIEPDRFTEEEVRRLLPFVRPWSAELVVARLFAALRTVTVVDERRRLAGEMHDGIAQELAALGFRIDLVSRVAKRLPEGEGAPVVAAVDEVRAELSQVITSLRSRITELSMSQRADRSIGGVLSTAVQELAASTGTVTTVTVRESRWRMPAHVEGQLFRLAETVLEDARLTGARHLSLRCLSSAKKVELEVSHDGASSLTEGSFTGHGLPISAVSCAPGPGGGIIVTVRLDGPALGSAR